MENNLTANALRIKELLAHTQKNATELGKAIGYKNGKPLSLILTGVREIGNGLALRITHAYPEISLEWLVKGRGEMLHTHTEPDKIEEHKKDQHWKVLVLILRKVAESKRISQQEIADRTGMLRTNVNRIFQLKYCPNLDTFILIAHAIGINFFFEDKESTTELNEIFEAAMTELGRRPDNLPKN